MDKGKYGRDHTSKGGSSKTPPGKFQEPTPVPAKSGQGGGSKDSGVGNVPGKKGKK
jgi:hypothetical protein